MVNEKTISYRIYPYSQEAMLQAGIDILIMVFAETVLAAAKFPFSVCIAVVVGYFVIATVLHYRVLMQAVIDKRKGDYVTETVSVKNFKEEFSFTGNWLGHSYICKFYPKEMHVQKHIVNVVNNHEEEKKLRAVMSFRRIVQFAVLDKQQIEYLQVTYLKRSKILIWCDLPEEAEKELSGKKKEAIKKAIHFINTSI
ncbi:MAG: hypothetical protein IJO14_10705 [Clostridia bacterium]|nr:hypothetical protein [Clostridia bacterium]